MRTRLLRSAFAAALLTACGPGAAPPVPPAQPLPEPVLPGVPITGDDMLIEGDVRIRPGIYRVADANGDGVLHVRGTDARLDLTGVTLIGVPEDEERAADGFTGYGVVVTDAAGAAVRGGTVRGFRVGVAVRDSAGALIEDVDGSDNFRQRLHSTHEAEDLRDWLRPHDNEAGEWESKYGAAISVTDSPGAEVRRCRARRGQNGLLLTRSDRARAYDNDFSFLSGWGIALYRTSDAIVSRNRLDWCVRGYSHGVYDRGQDSAGILVFEQCSRNTIALNSATHGGDGLFLYAGEETVQRTGRGGCNDNLVVGNDFSHAVANAIETTFSTGNRFLDNRLDDSRHGVWAGYSSDTLIRGNRIRHCDNGVSIEHGQRNAVEDNRIEDCGTGVHIWWDEDAGLAATAFGRERDVTSSGSRIGPWNTFRANRIDVRLRDDTDTRVVDNTLAGDAPRVELTGNCAGALFEGNDAPDARALVVAEHRGRVRWMAEAAAPLGPRVEGSGQVAVERRSPDGVLHHGHAPEEDDAFDPASVPGEQDAFLPDSSPRGRNVILIDAWGPLDPRVRGLRPATQSASVEATVRVLGVAESWRVVRLSPGHMTAKPREGGPNGFLGVWSTRPGYTEFELDVEIDGEVHRAVGSVFTARWNVRYFHWEKDPRTAPYAWRALLDTEPIHRTSEDELDFSWGAGAPAEGVRADRFATLATTDVELPAGDWRVRTISDDGIRVWVDDELVIDDWTHHAPTSHDAVVPLAAGRHRIRVEHFELDGWSALSVTLRPE